MNTEVKKKLLNGLITNSIIKNIDIAEHVQAFLVVSVNVFILNSSF
jgi:hypothetical protein